MSFCAPFDTSKQNRLEKRHAQTRQMKIKKIYIYIHIQSEETICKSWPRPRPAASKNKKKQNKKNLKSNSTRQNNWNRFTIRHRSSVSFSRRVILSVLCVWETRGAHQQTSSTPSDSRVYVSPLRKQKIKVEIKKETKQQRAFKSAVKLIFLSLSFSLNLHIWLT